MAEEFETNSLLRLGANRGAITRDFVIVLKKDDVIKEYGELHDFCKITFTSTRHKLSDIIKDFETNRIELDKFLEELKAIELKLGDADYKVRNKLGLTFEHPNKDQKDYMKKAEDDR